MTKLNKKQENKIPILTPKNGLKNGLPWTLNHNLSSSIEKTSVTNSNTDINPWKNISKRKFITNSYAEPLFYLNSPAKNDYEKILQCKNYLNWSYETNTYSGYSCEKRICIGCMNIKTAELINKLENKLNQIPDLYYVTLTKKAIPGDVLELKAVYAKMKSEFRKISRLASKHKISYNTIRRIECTFNFVKNTYHQHFHLLVQGLETSEFIREQWIRLNPGVNPKTQVIKPCDSNTIKELLKYNMKILKHKKEGKEKIYLFNLKATDIMYRSLSKTRSLQTTGSFLNIQKELDQVETQEIENKHKLPFRGLQLQWSYDLKTWVNTDNKPAYPNEFTKSIKIKIV